MKKILFVGIICLFCSISVFSQSKKKWEFIQSLNAVYEELIRKYPDDKTTQEYYEYFYEAYENFIKKYPNGDYIELAKQGIEQLEFLNAKHINTIKVYEEFIKKYPNGDYIELAKQGIEQLEFLNAKQINTIKAYEDFLSKYGKSGFVTDAKALILELKTKNDWQVAISENTVDGFEIYIRNHPEAKNIGDARLKLENLEWQNSKTLNTVSGYEQFIIKFPQSANLSEAKTNLETLDWNNAQTLGTADAFKSFLNKHPESSREKEAKAAIMVDMTTPLLVKAASKNDIEQVKLLLSKGENVNSHREGGPSALMYASVNDNLDMVKLLVSKGADINYQTGSESAIYLSDKENFYTHSENCHVEIVEYLVTTVLKLRGYRSPTVKEIHDIFRYVVNEAKMNAGGVGIEILTVSRSQSDKNKIEVLGKVSTWSGRAMYHFRVLLLMSPEGNKWTATGKML